MFEQPLSQEQLDRILQELRAGLEKLLGEQLADVLLYGSQARGDARPDSDIDVLVLLRNEFNYTDMLNLTSKLAGWLSLDNDVVISLVFVSIRQYEQIDTPFLLNVHREAIGAHAVATAAGGHVHLHARRRYDCRPIQLVFAAE